MLGFRTLPIYQQSEAAECGLAAVGMVAAYWGKEYDMPALRRKFPTSMQGASLNDMIRIARHLGLASRALRVDLGALRKIALPAVLHWEFNHFVVLHKVARNHVIIHDPAVGKRRISIEELSRSFTGVALELRPAQEFTTERQKTRIKLWEFFRQVRGVGVPLIQILIFSLLIQLVAVVSPFFSQLAIDFVVPANDLSLLKVLALGFGVIFALRPIIEWLRTRLTIYISTQFTAQLTSNLFRYLLSLPLPYFEKRSIGDLMTRFEASDRLRELLTQGFVGVFVDMFLGLVTLAMMFYYSTWLGFIVLITGLIVIVLRLAWVPRLRLLVNETLQKKGMEQSEMIESMRGISSIKFAQKEVEREAIWNNVFSSYVSTSADLEAAQANFTVSRDLIQSISMVLVIYLAIRFVISADHDFTLGAFFAFAAYRNLFFERLDSFLDLLIEFSMARVHLERLSEIISIEPEQEPSEYFNYNDKALELKLSDLSFRFDEGQRSVLDAANAEIRQGDRIVIFGPTGTGKTTLLKILGGIYAPVSGELRLNGVVVAPTGLRYLRSQVAAVLQADYLFRGSIIDNITFFDRFPDFELAMKCATTAGVHDEIMSLPMSYESLVGEMGTSLSQGQQQRVLLARALYQQKQLLILDEGTAHLDAAKEQEVMEKIVDMDITLVMTAHNAKMADYATQIWLIDKNGKLRVKPGPVQRRAY